MNYRIIIHALILLFILHIIIINTNYTVTIGNKVENFRNTFIPEKKINKKDKIEKMENDNSLNFLGDSDKDNDFIQKMNAFSQKKKYRIKF